MRALQVGDKLDVGGKVLFFSHRDAYVRASFVRVVFGPGFGSLTVSEGHYVYVYGSDGGMRLTAAYKMRLGDMLVCGKSLLPRRVHAVELISAIGLYNPQTEDGTIIVDGVLTSTYTTAVRPITAHALVQGVAPLVRRTRIGILLSRLMRYGAPRVLHILSEVVETVPSWVWIR